MSFKVYRILSLVFSIIQLPFYAFFLYINLTHKAPDYLLITSGIAFAILISLIETYVSIKAFNKDDCMLYSLVYENDGTINKVALTIVILLGLVALSLGITGLFFIVFKKDFLMSLIFLSISVMVICNVLIYFSYIYVTKKSGVF